MKGRKLIASMLAFILLLAVGLTACSNPDEGDKDTAPAETIEIDTQDDADADVDAEAGEDAAEAEEDSEAQDDDSAEDDAEDNSDE
jgi:predicted  nucleic acid-binding Zn-ribbon protein